MAWYEKYFADAKDQQGHYARIRIFTKTNPGSSYPYRMGGLTALALSVQGGQDKIDAPIIKTSLTFSLMEPPAPEYDYDFEGLHMKTGGWQEFYTPDSEAYKVVLSTSEDGTLWVNRWSGYITPDSWQESLDAYDTVTITARDNLGHLQDFDFDIQGTNGLISIRELIVAAMAKINLPMSYEIKDYTSNDRHALIFDNDEGEYNVITEAKINTSLFDGQTWYEVLEDTLEAIGWTCRWVDYNAIHFMTLRDLPAMGYADRMDQPTSELEFYGGGTRTLDPAYKDIKEEIEYKQKDKIERDARYNLNRWYDSEDSLQFHVESLSIYGESAWVEASAPIRLRWSSDFEDGWDNCHSSLNPEDYQLQDYTAETEGDAARDYLFVAANLKYNQTSPGGYSAKWNRRVQSTACKIRFELTEHPMCLYPQSEGKLGTYQYNLKYIKYRVQYTKDETTYYWDGYSWIQGTSIGNTGLLVQEYDPENEAGSELEIQLSECTSLGPNGKLTVELSDIVYVNVVPYGFGYGCYARIKSITLENSQSANLKTNTVTTINNSAYNIKCNRSPIFSPMAKTVGFSAPENYEAAMFRVSGNSIYCWPYNCRWDNETESQAIPFPAQVHKQILMYHHITNELLEGQAGVKTEHKDGYDDTEYPLIFFDRIFWYKNKKHVLLSGTLDLLTGRLTSAIFREYLEWDELWD